MERGEQLHTYGAVCVRAVKTSNRQGPPWPGWTSRREWWWYVTARLGLHMDDVPSRGDGVEGENYWLIVGESLNVRCIQCQLDPHTSVHILQEGAP